MGKVALQLLSKRRGKSPLELALDNYEMWYNADQALSLNKEYEITNEQRSKRKLTRADAQEVARQLKYWEAKVEELKTGENPMAPKIRTIYTV